MPRKPLRRLAFRLLVITPLVVVGCSELVNPPAESDSATDGDEPPISIAPDAWAPPSECLGIGRSCTPSSADSSCQAPDSICQSEVEVCIPPQAGRSRSVETPYCFPSFCMTYEEAACFCTREVGGEIAACASPSQLAGLCGGNSAICDDNEECCGGFACLENANSTQKTCRETCEVEGDCSTETDSDCRGVICENGQICVNSKVEDFAGCQDVCTDDDECSSGCCKLFEDGTSGFCADAVYCSCVPEEDACGTPGIDCCSGGICAGSSGNYSCKAGCKSDADCGVECCFSLSDQVTFVCEEC
jgi:hypothetical protein